MSIVTTDNLALERQKMITEVRADVLNRHPKLKDPHLATVEQCLTTRWDIKRTLSFGELPKAVREWISHKDPVVILDNTGKPIIRIYPDKRSDSESALPQVSGSPQPLARKGQFTIVTPVIAEISSKSRETRYMRVAMKRPKKGPEQQTQHQFDRERALASWLMPEFDKAGEEIMIARPIAIGRREILYEWVGDATGRSENLEEATLGAGDYLRVAADAADAIAWFHSKGLKYLDLSERNVVLHAQGRGKLVDWGSARQYEDIVDADTIFNERFYDWRLVVQQELHRGALDIADKYALGVLIRQFLLRYKLGELFEESDGKRGLKLKTAFARLTPILKISDTLRQSIMHPYMFYIGSEDERDPEYLKLDTLGHTFRILARIMDAKFESRHQFEGVIAELIDPTFQNSDTR